MAMRDRKHFFEVHTIDGNTELDYLDRKYTEMELETSDTFRIPKVMEYRPDLISLKFYGNYHMGWLIAHHNDFLDTIFDFRAGRKIDIPSSDNYFRYYNVHARSM